LRPRRSRKEFSSSRTDTLLSETGVPYGGLEGGRFFGDEFMRVDQLKVDTYEVFLTLDELHDLSFIADKWVMSIQGALTYLITESMGEKIILIKREE